MSVSAGGPIHQLPIQVLSLVQYFFFQDFNWTLLMFTLKVYSFPKNGYCFPLMVNVKIGKESMVLQSTMYCPWPGMISWKNNKVSQKITIYTICTKVIAIGSCVILFIWQICNFWKLIRSSSDRKYYSGEWKDADCRCRLLLKTLCFLVAKVAI